MQNYLVCTVNQIWHTHNFQKEKENRKKPYRHSPKAEKEGIKNILIQYVCDLMSYF